MKIQSLVFVVALLIASSITFLFYLSRQEKVEIDIMVASAPLLEGMKLSSDNTAWKKLPADMVRPNYIVKGGISSTSVIGKVIHSTVNMEQPITFDMFINRPKTNYAKQLGPDMHAIVLPLTTQTAIGSFLSIGDKVDIVLNRAFSSRKRRNRQPLLHVSEVILHNITVLALEDSKVSVPQLVAPSPKKQSTIPFGRTHSANKQSKARARPQTRSTRIIILAVTTKQAEIINVASKIGELDLMISSQTDAEQLSREVGYTTSKEVGYQHPIEKPFIVDVMKGFKGKQVELE